MKSKQTNRKQITDIGAISRAQLHVKILDLIANRVNPYKDQICFEKGGCNTCINSANRSPKTKEGNKSNSKDASEARKSTKASKIEPTIQRFSNYCIKDCIDEHQKKYQPKDQSTQNTHNLRKPMLSIESKVFSIELLSHNSPETQSKRGKQVLRFPQTQSEIEALKRQLLHKDNLIVELRKQLLKSKDCINELNKDLESVRMLARCNAYSDDHLHNNQGLSCVSLEPSSLKEVIKCGGQANREQIKPTSSPSIQANIEDEQVVSIQYQSWWRMIVAQATYIEQKYLDDQYD